VKYELRCVCCGGRIEATKQASTCPKCGPLKGTLDVEYPLDKLKSQFGNQLSKFKNCDVFREFAAIFPYDNIENLPSLKFGQTPLFQSPGLSPLTGVASLYIKDDSRNPSASFKDRASAVAIALARESGADTIACASTGNAASSLATMASSVGMRCVVFIPKNAPLPKLTQILIHGASAIRLDCNYDRAFDLCQEACNHFGWYNRNTAVNPFTGEGKKSAALEIACVLGYAPDAVVIPVGDGCIIGGIYKGFSDLLGLGLINKIPRLYGVQAVGASTIVEAFSRGGEIIPMGSTNTIADSIAVGCPRDGVKALRAARTSSGAMLAVDDSEILDAQRVLASKAGIFSEPAASASFAGLLKAREKKLIAADEKVVLLLTGHGLKDTATAAKNIECNIEIINPDIDSVKKKVSELFKRGE
jgi:threonine synthase